MTMETDQPLSIDGADAIEKQNSSSNRYAYEGEGRKYSTLERGMSCNHGSLKSAQFSLLYFIVGNCSFSFTFVTFIERSSTLLFLYSSPQAQ